MSNEPKAKVSVNLELDRLLVERIENAVKHLPPGWDFTRVLEVGAVELLEQLERKYNKGQTFAPFKAAAQESAGS